MKNVVGYKGYYGVISYSQEDNLFVARAVGTGRSYISCHGDTAEDAKIEFKISIDYYLEVCEAEGWTPCSTDPKVAREMEALLSKKNEDDFHVVENSRNLAFAH